MSLCLKISFFIFFVTQIALAQTPEGNQRELTDEEIAEQAFGKKIIQPEEAMINSPVFFETATISMGDVETKIKPLEKKVYANADKLFRILRRVVYDDWFEFPDIKAKIPLTFFSEIPWVAIDELNGYNVKITYDEVKLEIRVSVPAESRRVKQESLSKFQDDGRKEKYQDPDFFSGYVNYYLGETLQTGYTFYPGGRAPARAQFDSAFNFGSAVLEGDWQFTERIPEYNPTVDQWLRGDIRMVKDAVDLNIRSQLGDVTYLTRGFQTYRSIGGVSVVRKFSLNPTKLSYPTGNYEIFLKNPSKVEVWVNGRMLKILELPAGKHQIQDFPFSNGENSIRLEITDSFGRHETQEYSYFSSSELLSPGLNEYSYAIGALANQDGYNKNYDPSQLSVTASHRYGVNDYVTAGANIQDDPGQSLLGLEGLFSTDLGYFKFDPGLSLIKDGGVIGVGARTRYNYVDYDGPEKTFRSITLGLDYYSEKFLIYGKGYSENPISSSWLASYSRAISRTMNMNVGFNYQANRKITSDTGDTFSLSIGLGKKFENNLSANGMIRHTGSSSGGEEVSAFLLLVMSFPKEKQYVTAVYDNSSNSSKVDWNYNPQSGSNFTNYHAGAYRSDTGDGYRAELQHSGNRAKASASFNVNINPPDETSTDKKRVSTHTTDVQFASAVVYSNGIFGLGRPVADSFAIIKATKNLKGKILEINPQDDGSAVAQTDKWGPAVYSEIPSYNYTPIVIGRNKLSQGDSVPVDHFDLFPTYKSGFGIEIGTDATIYLEGTLLIKDQPLQMEAANAINLDDKTFAPITVFTNRKGVIRSEGFKPGRYVLEFFNPLYAPYEFSIPEGSTELFNLGIMTIKER